MEILITLAAAGWSATDKILQTAVKCERSEVEAVVASLCAGAGPRATAAAARRQVEAEASATSAQAAGASSSSGSLQVPSKSTPLPMSTEAFAVRVLTRLNDEFPAAENRLSALRVLEAAMKMEQDKLLQPSSSAPGSEDGAAASSSAGTPSDTTFVPTTAGAASAAASAPTSAAAAAAPTASVSRGGKPVVMPELGLGGGSKLLEKDGDEAADMGRHTGGRGGGISCPCCNPDDPQFMVDKMLMM